MVEDAIASRMQALSISDLLISGVAFRESYTIVLTSDNCIVESSSWCIKLCIKLQGFRYSDVISLIIDPNSCTHLLFPCERLLCGFLLALCRLPSFKLRQEILKYQGCFAVTFEAFPSDCCSDYSDHCCWFSNLHAFEIYVLSLLSYFHYLEPFSFCMLPFYCFRSLEPFSFCMLPFYCFRSLEPFSFCMLPFYCFRSLEPFSCCMLPSYCFRSLEPFSFCMLPFYCFRSLEPFSFCMLPFYCFRSLEPFSFCMLPFYYVSSFNIFLSIFSPVQCTSLWTRCRAASRNFVNLLLSSFNVSIHFLCLLQLSCFFLSLTPPPLVSGILILTSVHQTCISNTQNFVTRSAIIRT